MKLYLQFPVFEPEKDFLAEVASFEEAEAIKWEYLESWPLNMDGSLQGSPRFLLYYDEEDEEKFCYL